MLQDTLPPYAELHCISNFTFLRGASFPEELVLRADALGYTALALTDECSLAGVVRAHIAAKECGLKLIIGTELKLADGPRLVLLATDRASYGNLSKVITKGRCGAGKGNYHLTRLDLASGGDGCLALLLPGSELDEAHAHWLVKCFPGRAWLAVELFRSGDDGARLKALGSLARRAGLPLVAAGDVHMHTRSRRPLQDTLTAIRLNTPLASAGFALYPNGERHLRSRKILVRIYPEALIEETLAIAKICHFSLDELRYEYPEEVVPAGETPSSYLRKLTEAGMRERWPDGVSNKVRKQIEHELELIAALRYEPYFLTVYDIVQFARRRNILCQGRGSAANSAVCFCLGITEIDPARMEMLFERFISKERDEPPDIDVDFEHERREEVIQYVYDKYGRDRAALAATVITYQPRSAIRDVGKALGLSLEQVDRLAKNIYWWDARVIPPARLRELGFDAENPVLARLVKLVKTLVGFPRHLSQHVGGFVIVRGCLSELVPIENAAMPDRTVIEWDKDDLDALGLLKVDCLGLGMLTAIHRAFDLVEMCQGKRLTMATVPAEDWSVYEMIQHADTVGVFQIESRAQMAMLPRLKPANFYDLVIEVAIVRPGPIRGDMVHPYLRRRQGQEAVTYPSETVREVLERTLGVPIFQEQVIKLTMVAAGFSPGEADQLRRSMTAWRRRGGLEKFEQRLIDGMCQRGYSEAFARRIFQQIKGFGEYGFPESHAASFALLVYVSAWLKRHAPAAFTCALLNSQPMGFYAPAQLVQDARRHGVRVRPVDVSMSGWDSTLEKTGDGVFALRLGLRLVKGLSEAGAKRLLTARAERSFLSVAELVHRARLNVRDRQALASADALRSLASSRHQARWQVLGVEAPLPVLGNVHIPEAIPLLRRPTEGEEVVRDYASLGLTLRSHPLALLRGELKRLGLMTALEVHALPHGSPVRTGGLVIARQRPGTASGVVFITLEDETGHINLIVWNRFVERARRVLLGARLLGVRGEVQREGEVLHVITQHVDDYSHLLGELVVPFRDFH